MTKTIIQFAILFIVLVLFQVIVFNHLILWGVAVPMVFIYWMVRLPVSLNTNWMLTCCFLLGLTVDIFSDTPGLNSLSCTLFGGVRNPVLRLYFPREEELTNPEPTYQSLGPAVYMKYLLTMVLIYVSLYFIIESMSFFNPLRLLTCIGLSSVLTFILILAIDSLTGKRREKRL